MSMLICCNCGRKVWDQATNCMHCGTPVEETLRRLREIEAEETQKTAQENAPVKEDTPVQERSVVQEEIPVEKSSNVDEETLAQEFTDVDEAYDYFTNEDVEGTNIETESEELQSQIHEIKETLEPYQNWPPKAENKNLDLDIFSKISKLYDWLTEKDSPQSTISIFVLVILFMCFRLSCDDSSENTVEDDGDDTELVSDNTDKRVRDTISVSKGISANQLPTEGDGTWPENSGSYFWQGRQVCLDYDIKRGKYSVLSSKRWLFIENKRQPFLTFFISIQQTITIKSNHDIKLPEQEVILAFTDKSVTYLDKDEIYKTTTFNLCRNIKRKGEDMVITIVDENGDRTEYKVLPYGKSKRFVKFVDSEKIMLQMHNLGSYTVEIPYQLSKNKSTTLSFPMEVDKPKER